MENTIYAYGNSADIIGILQGIALIMTGAATGAYHHLMQSIALLSLLVVSGTAIAKLRGHDIASSLLFLSVFYSGFILPTMTVNVYDTWSGTQTPVNNIPLGVGLIASSTSHIGYWLTEEYETNFSVVGDASYIQTGMMFGSRLQQQFGNTTVNDPQLSMNMNNFVQNCVNPVILNNPSRLNSLVHASDIWAYIGSASFSLNPALPVVYNGNSIDCVTDYANLTNDFKTWANTAATSINSKLGIDLIPSSIVASATPYFTGQISSISYSTQQALQQYAMMNILRNANISQAAVLGSTFALNQINNQASISKTLADSALPGIRNLIEDILLGVSPIIMLLVIASGNKGGKVLVSYAMGFVWIELWAPLYSIVNTLATGGYIQNASGLLGTTGLTMVNANALANLCVSENTIASLMSLSIPAISLALVKGGEMAIGGVASSIMSSMNGPAASMGSQLGSGSIQGGNVNWGNVNSGNLMSGNTRAGLTSFGGLNDSRGMVSLGDGFKQTHQDGANLTTTNADGRQTYQAGQSTGPAFASIRKSIGAALQQEAGNQETAALHRHSNTAPARALL
jgi:hypothetical protein